MRMSMAAADKPPSIRQGTRRRRRRQRSRKKPQEYATNSSVPSTFLRMKDKRYIRRNRRSIGCPGDHYIGIEMRQRASGHAKHQRRDVRWRGWKLAGETVRAENNPAALECAGIVVGGVRKRGGVAPCDAH